MKTFSNKQVTAAKPAAVTITKLRDTAPTHRRNQVSRITSPKRQPLFGRGSGGGASLREAASPGVPYVSPSCRQVTAALSAAVTTTKPIGDHAHLTGGTKISRSNYPKRQLLFRRGGLGERRFS